jgi:hypothetical protein
VARDQGATVKLLLAEMNDTLAALEEAGDKELKAIGESLLGGTMALEKATEWLLATHGRAPASAAAGAVPYLKLFGTVAGGWLMARAALAATTKLDSPEADFYRAKKITARFYVEHVLPEAQVYRDAIVNGAGSVLALDETMFQAEAEHRLHPPRSAAPTAGVSKMQAQQNVTETKILMSDLPHSESSD